MKQHLGSTSHVWICPFIINSLRIILSDVSHWAWNHRHVEQHLELLPSRICSFRSEGRSTLYFLLQQTWQFQFPYHKLSVPEKQCPVRPPFSLISQLLYDMPGIVPRMNVLLWGCCDCPIIISGRDMSEYVVNFYGRYGDLIKHYDISLSGILHNIPGHDHM